MYKLYAYDDTRDLYRLKWAAEEFDLPYTTLYDAVQAGHIKSVRTGCGLALVRLSDVRHYIKHPPKRGRKPGNK